MTPADHGIEAVVLPTGQYVAADKIRAFNYNDKINALRLSFVTRKYVPQGVDTLSGRVRAIQEQEGRCAVTAHRFFRYNNVIYVQDADVRLLQLSH